LGCHNLLDHVTGGILGLAVFNAVETIFGWFGLPESPQSFDMITMLGFLILMGTVVNNPILILHKTIENVKTRGLIPVDAVACALRSRYRAIAISTVTTVVGVSPLVFSPGAGSELYRGVGIVVMAGIISSTVVTFYFLPAITVSVLEIFKMKVPRLRAESSGPFENGVLAPSEVKDSVVN
jgi:multidrug efflux pump subunit AcrB